jgi:hypothetical protein
MSGRIMLAEDERQRPQERPPEPPRETQGQPPLPEPLPTPAPPEPAPQPRLAAQDGALEEPDGGEPQAAKPEALPPEIQKRIDRENREKWEARREADLWRNRVQEYERQQHQQGLPQNEAVERAKQELRLEQQQTDFNRQCNEVYRKGQAEYADFDDAVKSLNATGWGNRPDALAMLTSLPDAHRVYRELAGNLDNAGRMLNLPPTQMAMELARMATRGQPNGSSVAPPQAAQPLPPVTQAPAPTRPVGGTTRGPDRPLDKVSMAEFIRRRDREESLSRIRR